MKKSLNEEVQEILMSAGSKASKAQALFKLGITKYEISLMIGQLPEAESTSSRLSYTFGVEIECLVPRRDIEQYATRNNMPFRYEGYNHVDNNSYYKFVSDSSIQGANGIECVSPVLKGGKNGFQSLETACKSLNEAGAVVNRSCGLHVHIGASNLTSKQYANVFVNYAYLESVIDTFMAPSRRANNSQWCRTLVDHLQSLKMAQSQNDVYSAMRGDRYHKVNPVSYARHKTIEFRQHQGSTDFKKISMWVTFCAKLVNWSKKNVLTSAITSIDDIPFLNATEKAYFKRRQQELA